MASTRASTSRYSLDDWNDLAPLSPQETQSIQRVSAAATLKPLPQHLANQPPPTSTSLHPRATLPLSRSRLDLASASAASTPSASPRSATPRFNPSDAHDAPSASATDPDDPLALTAPIDTAQQFHAWHTSVEAQLEAAQESHYLAYLSSLRGHIGTCTSLLQGLDDARALLSELAANHTHVTENSSALQAACEGMLDEQKHLLEVSDALAERLEYFLELERAVRVLNEPGEEVVTGKGFLDMVDRVEASVGYLEVNRDFHDADLYLLRFQQCLVRAMTLVKMYFTSCVKRTVDEVAGKVARVPAGTDLSLPALEALLYTKFLTLSPPLRLLLLELETRAHLHPETFLSLLSECHHAFFSSRSALLGPRLAEEVRRMDPGRAELVGLARQGTGFMREVAEREWEVAGAFFGKRAGGEEETYRFLSTLLDHLLDALRPRILHEPSLDKLCELCLLLQSTMALDAASALNDALAAGDDDDDLAEGAGSPGEEGEGGGEGGAGGVGLGRMRFAALVEPLLQDAQTRLVFRAQAVVQAEVLHYVPSAADLNYPAKLAAVPAPSSREVQGEEGEEEGHRFRLPSEEAQRDWYPTLRKTGWVLERLEQCVNPAIFTDFAGEAVLLCLQSLLSASSALTVSATAAGKEKTTGGDPSAEGQLFLIRHLLLLKEMVRSVDLVRRERGVEFGSVTEALATLLRTTTASLLNPRVLVDLASRGLQGVEETMRDAKTDLDAALKRACEALIASSSLSLTSALRAFLDRCTAHLSSPSASSSASSSNSGARALAEQPWATPEEVQRHKEVFDAQVEEGVREVVRRMREWLREEKTVGVLVPPLLDDILATYSTFYNLVRSEYPFTTSSTLVVPAEMGERLKRAAAGASTVDQ